MTNRYLEIASTPSVQKAQAANGVDKAQHRPDARLFDRFTEAEIAFIAVRDSFYMATVSETGWPYVQHRGGPPGFLRVIDERTLAFADFRGNRQYVSVGNLDAADRVALFLMDYPGQRRLKIYAHAEIRPIAADPDLAKRLTVPDYRGRPERVVVLHLEAFDWNCSQHITRRFAEREVAAAIQPLREHLLALEMENSVLRRRLVEADDAEAVAQ